MDEEENLRFLVGRNWRALVEEEDVNFIESLMRDFQERAKMHPKELFKQVSSLGVGPLVTHEVGPRISDHMPESEMDSQFIEF